MHRSPESARRRALALLTLTTFFWGLSFPVIKALILLHARLDPSASPVLVTAWILAPRFVVAAALLALIQAVAGGRAGGFWPSAAEGAEGAVVGIFAAAGMWFQNDGLRFVSASTSAFLTQLYAILIPLLLALRARRLPGARIVVAVPLVAAGVAILGRFDWRTLSLGRGECETLLGSALFVLQILWVGRPAFARVRAIPTTFAMAVTQAAAFLSVAAIAAPSVHSLGAVLASPAWIALTAVLGIFSTAGAFLLMNLCQPAITPTEAGLVYCLEPLFASVLALFLPAGLSLACAVSYPNERPTAALLAGGALITAANVLVQAGRRVRSPPASPGARPSA